MIVEMNHRADVGGDMAVMSLIQSTFGGQKTPEDAPEPDEDADKPERDEPTPDLDEELDESFPASDPPASTQP